MSAAALSLTSLLKITARKFLGRHLPRPVTGTGCLSFSLPVTLCFIMVARAEMCAVIPNCPSVPKTKKQATYSTRLFYIHGVGEEEGEREDRVRRGDREGVERKRGRFCEVQKNFQESIFSFRRE